MKRYFVFIFDTHYPFGGMEDFAGDFDSLEDIKAAISLIKDREWRSHPDYVLGDFRGERCQVWDTKENKPVDIKSII